MGEATLWKDVAERGKEIKPNSLALKTNITFCKPSEISMNRDLVDNATCWVYFLNTQCICIRSFAIQMYMVMI